jgi:hypothetical protein
MGTNSSKAVSNEEEDGLMAGEHAPPIFSADAYGEDTVSRAEKEAQSRFLSGEPDTCNEKVTTNSLYLGAARLYNRDLCTDWFFPVRCLLSVV